ncbi:FtsX-like permease family protein [Streptomyces yunnanensis]|uniref:FtsX-like permease family protein n=1 Tax=Streptomyces yunnanensis TaxID=156453 RepID=A0ABY8A3D5_9ACTN|nr:FtsX-like permease family protein [Streptomyces yunnanensis]WEB38306.1 FtsX-like permease family protein [Streptomyces yunnanensis]
MNLFKRAWWRLTGRPGTTLMLVGLFFVICTLVLSGFLIQSAAARAADGAKKSVGAVATMQLDVNALINSGKNNGTDPEGQRGGTIGSRGDLRRSLVNRICASSVVRQCNYTTDSGAFPTGSTELYQPVPAPRGQDSRGTDLFKVDGIRDLNAVAAFRNGDATLVAGHGIGPHSKRDEIVIEERLAKRNGLKVGDTAKLRVGELPAPGQQADDREYAFKVVGIYRSGTADTGTYVPAMMDPANQIYATPDGASTLLGKGTGADGVLKQATFTLDDPKDLDRLKKDAEAAGADLEIFPLSINDKQYQTLVGPITKTADFATVTVWLVAVAGTVILALIVASNLRERRGELGILLSLGEKKPKLLGQHLIEVVACAVLAIGLAGVCSQFLSQAVGDRLLASEVSTANQAAANEAGRRDPSDPTGMAKKDQPEAKPIDAMDVRLGSADIAKVGITGLGIAALATCVPGARVLRLNPRDILTKGD